MKISYLDVKIFFLKVISREKSFEDARAWAFTLIKKNDFGELELDEKEDMDAIFSAITFLITLDTINGKEGYLYTIDDVRDEYQEIFHEPAP